jgi:hypothetical protein
MGTVSRVHTFASGAVLTAAQLNNEFDNLLTSSAINGGLDATNLGVTAGQITASKAIVVDGSRNLDDGTTSNQINNLVLSGTLTVAGATTQTGALSIDDTTDSTSTTTGSIHTDGGVGIAKDLIVGDDVKLLTDSAVLSLGVGSDATLTHDGTTGLTIAANPVIVDSGDALTLDAHTGIHIFKDAGTEVLRFTEGNSGDVTIKLATNGKDLIFTDHGDATGLKVLDAAAGINVPGEVQTTKIAYTDGDDALTIADGGGVTTSGTFESGGAATLASLVCTAAGTFGGGYGATGATISTAGVGQFNGALTTDGVLTAASLDISGNADIDGTLEADAITLNGTALGSLYSPIAGSTSIVTVGTIGTGTWQGTKVASAYLDDQTAHLNVTQSFTGAKTFGAATQFNSTVTVGVDDTGYDVQLFGATSGSSLLWDQSADDLIFTNAGIAVGSDATGDIYYRNSSGFLARLGASTDGHVLTTGGAGTIPAWEALPGGGTFSGPGSSTDNAVVRFNGTGGATGQNSGVTIDDSNNATGFANLTLSGELDAATGDFSGDVDIDGTLETDALTIGGTALLANDTNNRVTTATGSGTFNGEANLTFDGSTLGVAGAVTITKNNDYGVSTFDGTNAGGTIGLGTLSADANGGWLFKNVSYNGSAWAVNNSSVGAGAMKFDASGNIILLTQASGSGLPAERMRLDSAGRLLVASTASVTTGGANCGIENHNGLQSIIRYDNSGAANSPVLWLARTRSTSKGTVGTTVNNGDTVGLISFVADDGTDLTSQAAGISAAIDGAPGSNDTPGRLMFSTTADGAASSTERMRILSSGAIMVGKTASNVGVVGSQIEAGGNMNLTASADRLLGLNRLTSTGDLVSFKYAGSEKGSISTDGTNTAFNTSSDYRLKENIISLTGALTRVAQLQPRRFNFKETPDVTKDGFIAHEASTVVPEAVTGTKDATKTISNVIVDSDGAILDEGKTEAEWTSGKERTLVSEATEAVDAVLYADGDEIPDGKSVGDVKTPAIDAADAVYDDPAYAADTVWHETLTVPVYQGIDQAKLVPLLTAAIQELTARVAALESA